jgi:glycosyltransferase involved in cell wall biosynthesis
MGDLQDEKNDNSPMISIGIVVYNGVEHIRRCLDSIVKQSYRNIELIVVDGDSKDGTQNVLQEYAEHISVLVSEPDKGIYDAMNKVCSLATGDWLIFLGCDDVLLDVLGRIAKLMVNPDALYYGNAILRSNGVVYGGKFSKFTLAQRNFCHQAVFYPRVVYKDYSYGSEYKMLADYAYNIKLVGIGIPYYYLGETISIFNDRGRSFLLGDAEFAKDQIKLIRASFGNKYALVAFLLIPLNKLVDNTIGAIGNVLKRMLPHSCWKYLQTSLRHLRSK